MRYRKYQNKDTKSAAAVADHGEIIRHQRGRLQRDRGEIFRPQRGRLQRDRGEIIRPQRGRLQRSSKYFACRFIISFRVGTRYLICTNLANNYSFTPFTIHVALSVALDFTCFFLSPLSHSLMTKVP